MAEPAADTPEKMKVSWSPIPLCDLNADLSGYKLEQWCHPLEDENTECMIHPPDSSGKQGWLYVYPLLGKLRKIWGLFQYAGKYCS